MEGINRHMEKKRKIEINTTIATIYVEDMHPTENKYPDIIENQFQFRKFNHFTGDNVVAIADMGEAIWWNRPQAEDTEAAWGVESDGRPCCNLPIFLGKNKIWKSNYNVLLNKNNVPTIVQLQFQHELTQKELLELSQMSFTVIRQTLLRLGVQESDLCAINNDLLLRGKKFVGSEQVIRSNIYTECLFITLKYKEEKDIFKHLTSGKVSATANREITGLIDEYENFTKEDFLKIYCEEFKKYLDQFTL